MQLKAIIKKAKQEELYLQQQLKGRVKGGWELLVTWASVHSVHSTRYKQTKQTSCYDAVRSNKPTLQVQNRWAGGVALRLSRHEVSRDLRKVSLSLLGQRRQITLEGRGKSG